MKWILRLVGVLLGLVVLLVALGAFLLWTFDPNAYRSEIETGITEWTGRSAELAGPVRLQLLPELAVSIESIGIGNPVEFGDDDFVRIDLAAVSLAMLPLLRGEIEVREIRIEGARASLMRREDGRSNWDDLVERFHQQALATPRFASAQEAPVESLPSSPPVATPLHSLAIAGLEIRDLNIDWDDRQAKLRARIETERFRLTDFRSGVDTPLELRGRLSMQPDGQETETLAIHADGNLNLDFRQQRFALNQLVSDLRLELSPLPAPLTPRLALDVIMDQALGILRVDNLQLDLEGVQLKGQVSVQPIGGTASPTIAGRLQSNRFDPEPLAAALGVDLPDTSDPDSLSAIELAVDWTGNPQALLLAPVRITVDDATFEGSVQVHSSADRPLLTVELSGNRLDLDRYLPPPAEATAASDPTDSPAAPSVPAQATPAQATGDSDAPPSVLPDLPIELPTDLLRAFDLDGRINLGSTRMFGLELQDVRLIVRAREGEWRLEPLSGSGHGGNIELRLMLDAGTPEPRVAARADLQEIEIGSVLEAVLARPALIEGSGSLYLDLETAGSSLREWNRRLQGEGNLNFADGLVNGINVARIIRQAEARLRGEAPEPDNEPNATDFAALKGNFRVDNGRVQTTDLTGESPLLRVAGRGYADLPTETLDFQVDTTLVATLEGQGGRSLEDLRGLRLPIQVSGYFAEPRFRLDLEDMLEERLQDRARREIEQLQDRVLERLGVGAGSQSDEAAAPAQPAPESPGQEIERQLQRGLERLFQR